jgi:hypothetical protein
MEPNIEALREEWAEAVDQMEAVRKQLDRLPNNAKRGDVLHLEHEFNRVRRKAEEKKERYQLAEAEEKRRKAYIQGQRSLTLSGDTPTGTPNFRGGSSFRSEPGVGLANEFRSAGFPGLPGQKARIPWQAFEDRAVTWTGSVDNVLKSRQTAGPFGYDQRWAWPAFQRVPVPEGTTSVDVLTQTARSLATPANTVRAVEATSTKPETGSTLTIVTNAMKQIASKQAGIPNVYLHQREFNTVIENDLRLAVNDGLDSLVLAYIATSGFQAPGTDPLLVSIRKAMTTILNSGYSPDTLLLTPANSEALDVAVSGISGGTQDFVFEPGQFAPGTIFGLQKRICKTIPAAAVVDSNALGKYYVTPVDLAHFEENAGATNSTLVRMELNAVFGGERTAAAVRIAAS